MLPRTAYVLLWFPKSSETFILREVQDLYAAGLPLRVFTLYGPWRRNLSAAMRECPVPVERLGVASLPRLLSGLLHWLVRRPGLVTRALLQVMLRRWRSLEAAGENLWALLCAFHVARRCMAESIAHIHAPWATGPATTAWIAARLCGISFSFTGRSRDIFPPDGALAEKAHAAAFVRTDVPAHAASLARYLDKDAAKLRVVLSAVPLRCSTPAPVPMRPPYHVVAIGRFVPKKGFAVLIEAAAQLAARGVPFRLTLAGGHDRRLERLAQRLNVSDLTRFPGFLVHDDVPALLASADVFVAPSVVAPDGDRDGIPNTLVEALAHRLPVVGTDVGGIPNVVEDGVTGLLVQPDDPQALATAIERLVADRTDALRLANAGEALVRERFDGAACCRGLLELFTDASA